MPIYTFECKSCGLREDFLLKPNEKFPISLEACGGKPCDLEKVLSAAEFRLKGTGWHETDFKTSFDKQRRTDNTG